MNTFTKRIIVFLLLLLSFILYFLSEVKIDSKIINTCFVIFVIDFILMEGRNIRKGEFVSINIVFSFVYFFATYAFAIFIAQSEILQYYFETSPSQIKYIDFNYITKGVSMSTVAYSLYTLGYLWSATRINNCWGFEIDIKLYKISNRFLWVFFLLSLGNIFFTIISSPTDIVLFMERNFIYDYFRLFLVIVLLVKNKALTNLSKVSFPCIWKAFKIPLIMSGLLTLIFFSYGERGEPISIILIVFGFIHFFCYKFKLKTIILVALVGIFFMYGIRVTRKTDNSINAGGISSFVNSTKESVSGNSLIFLFSDLIGTTNELCYGIEITETKGVLHPQQIILLPFYPLPFMPSIMSSLILGIPFKELSPITTLNGNMIDMAGQSCFGTHIVVDVYMRFGFIGLIIAFFILGIVVSNYQRNMFSTIISATCFLLIFANSFYLPRDTMLSLIREITNVYIFIALVRSKNL